MRTSLLVDGGPGGSTAAVPAFPEHTGTLQGNDTWDTKFLDNSTLVANVTLFV